jgi:hypothetical protein
MSVADYRLNPDFADADELQRFFSDIARRLTRAENQEALIQAATRDLIEFGLQRVDENLGPALTKLEQAAELGFLVATSATSLTLATGEAVFEITEGAQRDLFKPTPVLTITREAEGAESQYAVARLTSYDPETGGLVVDVQSISGISGAHDDWVISASTGLAPSIITFAATVAADKAIVAADKATTLGYKNDAQTAAANAASAVSTLLAGYVSAALGYRNETEGFRNEAEGFKNAASDSAAAAAQSAEDAAMFDPSSYYTKAETYTQAEVDAAIADAVDALLAGAPGALDTLNELAAALGDDANFATTMMNALALKAPQATTYTKTEVDDLLGALQVDEFAASGTWSKHPLAKLVCVELWGAGGGGGSGRTNSSGATRSGGKGGGGGIRAIRWFFADDLDASIALVIGAGGVGGATVTATATNGNNGGDGGDTTFGGHLIALGGQGGAGGNNSPSQTSLGSARNSDGRAHPDSIGGNGGNGGLTLGSVGGASKNGGAGGGGGAGSDTNNAGGVGGEGGKEFHTTTLGGGPPGGALGVNDGASGDPTRCEGGGGGGCAAGTGNTNGGNGGDGGRASGGGGGGAATGTGDSGAGGAGGDGWARVIQW